MNLPQGKGGGGTETIEKYADATIAALATYTPASSGIFFLTPCGSLDALAPWYYSTIDASWYAVKAIAVMNGFTAIGDGVNFRVKNNYSADRYLVLMRHYYSTGTYERARDESLAAGTTWKPSTTGFFAVGGAVAQVRAEMQQTTLGWSMVGEAASSTGYPATILIGDGVNFRVKNADTAARVHVTMRAKLT
jgi:hypothetical protein